MFENRVSQKRSTCCGRSSSSAASEIVRNASGDLSKRTHRAPKDSYFPARTIDLLILDFNTLLGLNTSTCRGRIGTSSPVLGFRPIRWFFERTWNEPKDESFTFCPATSASATRSRTRSTSSADSVRDKPTASYTASARSARVTVFCVIDAPPIALPDLSREAPPPTDGQTLTRQPGTGNLAEQSKA